jgi:hypothetical protein
MARTPQHPGFDTAARFNPLFKRRKDQIRCFEPGGHSHEKHALFADKPLEHYLVTPVPFQSEIVMRKLFERVHHFNIGNKPPFSNKQLLEWFDEEGKIASGEIQRARN